MVKRGQTDGARPILEHDLEAELGGYYCGNAALIISGLLEIGLIEGQLRPERALVETGIDVLSAKQDQRLLEVMTLALRGVADAARAARHLGNEVAIAEARDLADSWIGHVEQQLAERSEKTVAPDFDVLVAQCRAEHARAHNRDDPERWAAVVAGWELLGHPWPTAYSKWRQAEAVLLARSRQAEGRSLARRLLRGAHTVANRLGAKPLISDIEDLATRARIDLVSEDLAADSEPEPVAPFDLTPRELKVLELVAEGYSNGKELFISTKTASVHVSNILRKLGASNRIEAAAIANTAGIARTGSQSG
jgi:DNA-binding CsgD family transcriptional regulator